MTVIKCFVTIGTRHTGRTYRDYELFKESIAELVSNNKLNDEEIDKYYTYIKAALYNIDIAICGNNFVALEQEIERIESIEKKDFEMAKLKKSGTYISKFDDYMNDIIAPLGLTTILIINLYVVLKIGLDILNTYFVAT
jgi:hypothetical protein